MSSITHPQYKTSQLKRRKISRQFLLLELLIALFLVGSCALPLAQLPMQATQEQIKSLCRSQSQRLADRGFCILKEKLYKNETAWNEIARSTQQRVLIFEDECNLSLSPLLSRKFKRSGTVKCISKKVKGMEEWWLMVARIEISPMEKKGLLFKKKGSRGKDAKAFAHYLILHKSPSPVAL